MSLNHAANLPMVLGDQKSDEAKREGNESCGKTQIDRNTHRNGEETQRFQQQATSLEDYMQRPSSSEDNLTKNGAQRAKTNYAAKDSISSLLDD